jgi:hypothetical protein
MTSIRAVVLRRWADGAVRTALGLTRGLWSGGITPVPKYDAFGREIGEDTLEGLGGSSAERDEDLNRERTQAQAAPVADPPREPDAPVFGAPAPDPAAPQRPVFAPPSGGRRTVRVGRRTGLGCLGVLVTGWTLLVILGVAAGLILALVGSSSVENTLIDGPQPSESPESSTNEPAKPAKPPRGLERRSLVRRANFARALRRLRAAGLGRLRSFSVRPERLNAQLLTKGGRLRSAQVTFDGEVKSFGSSGPGFGALETVPFGRVNTAAPERLVRQSARRLGHKTSRLDYLTHRAGTGGTWIAHFKGGRIALGDARGTFVRRSN